MQHLDQLQLPHWLILAGGLFVFPVLSARSRRALGTIDRRGPGPDAEPQPR